MIESACEADDRLMEKYLEGEALTEDEILLALRKATIQAKLVPVLVGSAFKNKGVQPAPRCCRRLSSGAIRRVSHRRHLAWKLRARRAAVE